MLCKDAFTSAPAHLQPIFFVHRSDNADNVVLISRQKNLLARGKEFIQAIPGVGKNGGSACRSFEKSDRR
jgi:hypothetical protein